MPRPAGSPQCTGAAVHGRAYRSPDRRRRGDCRRHRPHRHHHRAAAAARRAGTGGRSRTSGRCGPARRGAAGRPPRPAPHSKVKLHPMRNATRSSRQCADHVRGLGDQLAVRPDPVARQVGAQVRARGEHRRPGRRRRVTSSTGHGFGLRWRTAARRTPSRPARRSGWPGCSRAPTPAVGVATPANGTARGPQRRCGGTACFCGHRGTQPVRRCQASSRPRVSGRPSRARAAMP